MSNGFPMKSFFRRKYQTIGLLIVIGILFYLLQYLTLSQLGHVSHKRSFDQIEADLHDGDSNDLIFKSRKRVVDGSSKFDLNKDNDFDLKFLKEEKEVVNKEKLKSNGEQGQFDHRYNKNNYVKSENQKDDSTKNTSKLQEQHPRVNEMEKPKKNVMRNNKMNELKLRGVHPKDLNLYHLFDDGLFTCIHAKQVKIKADQLNDNFCDCPDSSDEPGTSACPDSNFYCTTQVMGQPAQFVLSSRVNDGICDCCDGSDEWAGILVPSHMRIKVGEPQGAVFHAPCTNRCSVMEAAFQKDEEIRNKGRMMQHRFLEIVEAEVPLKERWKYGPNGIFYPLSKSCFKIKSGKFEYKVCPFVSVMQDEPMKADVNVGRNSNMEIIKGQHVLMMTGGDSFLCPHGQSRQSKVIFVCGLEDKLTSMHESELCEYTFNFETPAAC